MDRPARVLRYVVLMHAFTKFRPTLASPCPTKRKLFCGSVSNVLVMWVRMAVWMPSPKPSPLKSQVGVVAPLRISEHGSGDGISKASQ